MITGRPAQGAPSRRVTSARTPSSRQVRSRAAPPAGVVRRPFQRRQPRRTSRAMKNSSTSPIASSTPAMAAAARGCWIANATRANTATSSRRLMPMLVTGSGEVLTASRIPALIRCDSSAVTAADRGEHDLVERGVSGTLPASSAPITAPAVGRIERGDGVPRRVDVRDLVGDELHGVHEPGDRQHVPAAEHVGDVVVVADPVRDAQHEHDQVGVDAAGPAARERQGEGLHAGL